MEVVLGASPQFFALTGRRIAAPKITITRPNNATPYVAGGVLGAAVDARLTLAVPAIPADAIGPTFAGFNSNGLVLVLVNHRAPTDAAFPSLNLLLATQPFVSVLADQAPLVLTDAEIATLYTTTTLPAWGLSGIPSATGTSVLKIAAGGAGRRGIVTGAAFDSGSYLVPGATLGLYLWTAVAYVPIANEMLDIYPFWTYNARVNG